MKNFSWLIISIVFLAACQQSAPTDKKAQLDKLQKEQADLTDQITKLQKEISATDTSKKNNAVLVAFDTLAPVLFNHFIEIQGKVESDQNVEVRPQASGAVTAVNVVAGAVVSTGQVLATLDASVVQAQMQTVQTQLDLANTIAQKTKALYDQNIGTQVQLLQSQNNVESLKKQLDVLQQQMDMTQIKSPINGTVDDVELKVGELASPASQEPAFRVVNMSNLKATAKVAENYVGKIHVGDPVTVSFPDLNRDWMEQITNVAQFIDPNSRSFTVEARLFGADPSLMRPNMLSVLKVKDYTNLKAIAVPVNILQTGDSSKFLFVAINENGKWVARKRDVAVGLDYGGMAEVTSGLQTGDHVITTGYQDIEDGQAIIPDNK
jgi:membrane fusion protein, multidrug efflux system